MLFVSTMLFAQERKLHLFFGGNAGRTNFSYTIARGTPNPNLGFGGSIGAQYYFNKYLGIATGLDFSIFNTNTHFQEKKISFTDLIDEEQALYDITILLSNWTEKQKTYFLDIPLLMKFQCKWGRKEMHGFYLGLGLKIQIPVFSDYTKSTGDLTVSVDYPELEEEEENNINIPLPWGDLEANENFSWNGKNQLKRGCAIVGEAGLLIGLSKRVNLMLGVSVDYGFANIKKNADNLLEVVKDGTSQNDHTDESITYTGILNNNKINMIHPVSVRGTAALRIMIGKLEKNEKKNTPTKKLPEIYNNNEEKKAVRRDTIIVKPIITPIYLPLPDENDQGKVKQKQINENYTPESNIKTDRRELVYQPAINETKKRKP